MSRSPAGWTTTGSAPCSWLRAWASPAEHPLVWLLALNGLRVSGAVGAEIQAMGTERRHRTLVITGKDGKVVTIALAPRTARAIDLAIVRAAAKDRSSSPPTGVAAATRARAGVGALARDRGADF